MTNTANRTPSAGQIPAFDLLRLVMLLIVTVHHAGLLSGVLQHGYMVV